jgi:hypothetical protein
MQNSEEQQNVTPEQDVEMSDVAKATETELQRCVRIFNQQKEIVDGKRQLVLDIFDNLSPLCLLPEGPSTKEDRLGQATLDMEKQEKQLEVYQKSFHRKYPMEPTFGGVAAAILNERADEQAYTKMVKELPGLCFNYDSVPPMVSKAPIHTEVAQFIEHFEQVFRAHRVNIERHYQETLEFCLSSSVLNHYKTQQASMEGGQKETWSLAKEWLTSFGETPANTIAKWQTLLNLPYKEGESSGSYFTRWRDALKKANTHKLTLEQVAAIVAIGYTPMAWRRKFHEELESIIKEEKNSEDDLLNILIKLDNNLVIANKRSGLDSNRPFLKKQRSNPDEHENDRKTRCTFKIWDAELDKMRYCKETYTPDHKKICPIKLEKLAKQEANETATSANKTPVARSLHKHYHNKKQHHQGDKKVSRAAKKTKKEAKHSHPHEQSDAGRHGWSAPIPRDTLKVTPGSDLAKSKYAPRPSMIDEIANGLFEDQRSADDQYDQLCKLNKTATKEKTNVTKFSPLNQDVGGEVCVPVLVGTVPVMALVDSGANFSSLDQRFCLENKIAVEAYKDPLLVGLADSKLQGVIYGKTNALQIHYNYKTYTATFDVMDLAQEREMSIGTDLMTLFGIGYTGLAVSWTPPVKTEEESPFKDVVVPNEDPYGTPAQQSRFLAQVQSHIDRNQAIDKHSLCTHPDAVVRLDTPPNAEGFRFQYKIPETLIPKVRETVEKWVADGVIVKVPSNADNRWNSPLTLAPKKDSTGKYTDKRPCLDPRHINKYLKADRFPLPNINDIFKKFADAEVYTTLDLTNAFHRFPILPEHRHKTAFTDPDGRQFMFVGCPFGLTPISSKFQRVMTTLFTQPPFHSFVATFVDDIVIYSSKYEEHVRHTQLVIDELTRYNLILNPKKCHFAQKTIYLLGFCVSAKGKSFLDPRKVTNAQEWPIPTTGKDIQQFLGLVNYFHQYLPKAPLLAEPLNALRNHQGRLGALWTEDHTIAFNKVKESLVKAPYLFSPKSDLPFHVATDASDVGIGAVLYQIDQDGTILHNGFMARALTKSERNYQITKKELLAIIFALNKFHQHLWGRHFTLYTDHKALVYIHSQRDLNAMLSKWFDTLLDYNFDVVHLPGMDNVLPDALSRLFPTVKDLGEGNDGSEQTKQDFAVTKSEEKLVRSIQKMQLQDDYLEPPTEGERSRSSKRHIYSDTSVLKQS